MSAYKDFKNHLHNTLDITKEQIREMTAKAVYKVVERKVEVFLRDEMTVQRLVDRAIQEKLTYNNMFWHNKDSLDKYVKDQVVKKLLGGVELEVRIKGKPPKKRAKS